DQVAHVRPDAAIWDIGAAGPAAATELSAREDTLLALAAPRTPLGYADVTALVEAIETAQGPAALRRVAVVLSDIYQHGRRLRRAELPVAAMVDIPFDSALAVSGPLPGPDRLRRHTKIAVRRWIDLAAGALAH